MPSVILVSQSKQRAALLRTVLAEFEVVPANIDELAIEASTHQARAAAVAIKKIQEIEARYPDSILIAADTFVLLGNQRLEKPDTNSIARQMLQRLSGKSVEVVTGWAYSDPISNISVNKATIIKATFRNVSNEEIETYVSKFPVTDWAGGFSLINLEGISMMASIEGSLTGILGLPLEEIVPLLKQSGVK